MKDRLSIFSCNSTTTLSKKVCNYLNIPLANAVIQHFPDGEIDVKLNDDVRGADVFIIQSTSPPVNENLMELLITIDCLRRASADRITAVIPYFGYARQDRKAEGRVPITARLVANLITTSGANRVLAIDLHAPQLQGFFDIPMDHIYALPVIIDHLKRLEIPDLVFVSPDIGGVKLVRAYARRLDLEIAIIDKRRIGANETEVMHLVGNVEGKNVIILDDIISTGTSIMQAAKTCKQNGAKDVYLCATHAVFSEGSIAKLKEASAKQIIVTDTILLKEEVPKQLKNLVVLSVANLLGEAIRRIHRSESVSALFV